jgi:hypothetical protein
LAETDLAGPLYEHLAAQGYTVRSEVKDCDIAAIRGDDLLVIELKKTLNVALLVQAVRRQRLTDSVYIAIPRPSNKWKWWKESRGVQHLLRRLELGLILVSLEKGTVAPRRAGGDRAALGRLQPGRQHPHAPGHGVPGERDPYCLLSPHRRETLTGGPARAGHRGEDSRHPPVESLRVVRARGPWALRHHGAR